MIKDVMTKNAPEAIGPYSQAKVFGNLVFTSGQIGINPESGQVNGADIKGQTEQAIKNISEILKASGSSLEKTIKTTCFITNISDFAEFNSVYEKYFKTKPARSCVEVSNLPKGVLCEIEAIAYI